MAKTVELFYELQNGRPSLRFHVVDTVEGNARDKFQEMLNDLPEPIAETLNSLSPARLLSSAEVEVKDVPAQKPSKPKTQANKSGNNQKITEGQLYCIHKALAKSQMSEEDFCREHGVDRLEDITKFDAIKIVSEIKKKDNNQSSNSN